MKTRLTRRTFLAAAGCVGGGLALGSRLAPSLLADEKPSCLAGYLPGRDGSADRAA